MSELLLPQRALKLAPDAVSAPRAYYWSTPIILVLAVFLLVWEGPGVLRDFTISQNPVVVEDGDVQNGRCTTRKAVFTDCEARLVYRYDGRDYATDVEIMFVDFHVGDYETGLVISGDHPELATITLGLDKLWNRIITLALLTLILGGLSVGMIFLLLRIWRVRRALRRPAMLVPVPVEIQAFDRKGKTLSITYVDTLADDRTKRSAYTRMHDGEEPLIVGTRGDKPVALAVRHGKTALPVLLDDRLMRIELTDAERAQALLPFRQTEEAHGGRTVLVDAPRKTRSIWWRLQVALGVPLLIVVGVIGFWFWYVLASDTQFQSPGMDINNMMPGPVNRWGCDQLQKRFGDQRAPFGCTASDYTSWK
ncbi:hypothetical protein [Rhizobium sp. Leaf341]|uniref:hypothetical protein n=1 Tax=Rhizobium sp. Leaf341 TaxID=1736344 RepID=UPI0007140DC8|nr:hypothetical protein [Rhizobium sp. Leaf341]KQR67833.1 hypothetical protein ASG03_09935 [Rhizobium sp. Leaf341]